MQPQVSSHLPAPSPRLQEIARISPEHALGALCLDSQPLKASLKTEAAAWKERFSRTIHLRAHTDLSVGSGGTVLWDGGVAVCEWAGATDERGSCWFVEGVERLWAGPGGPGGVRCVVPANGAAAVTIPSPALT